MLDDELRALVSADPSPGFEARVRRAARTAAPTHAWDTWWVRSLAVSALTAVVALAAWRETRPLPVDPGGFAHANRAAELESQRLPASAMRPGTEASSPTPGEQANGASWSPLAPPAPLSRPQRAEPGRTIADPAREPGMLVNRAESQALQRLLASPPTTLIEAAEARLESDLAPVLILELSIAPLVIEEIEGDSDER